MSSTDGATAIGPPRWLGELLGAKLPEEGGALEVNGRRYTLIGGILRGPSSLSDTQSQTAESFGFKWRQWDDMSRNAQEFSRRWLIERYGDVTNAEWWNQYGPRPVLLDAGCGMGYSAFALFGDFLKRVRYVGVDISTAVEIAARRLQEHGIEAALLQDDLSSLPFPPGSVDVIFSEGVLHHTDSTEHALKALASLLVPGGRFLFYVYRRKGPIREFTDDHVRDKLQAMTPEKGWEAMKPLTRLGQALGELGVEIEVPEDIDLLEIPAGRYDLQRLFYWHVCKAFYRPDFSFEELNLLNYDWFAPANAQRQSPEEVHSWCKEMGLEIERQDVQEAGITVIARLAG